MTVISVLVLCAIFFRIGYTTLKNPTGPKRPSIVKDVAKSFEESDTGQDLDAITPQAVVIVCTPSVYSHQFCNRSSIHDYQVVSHLPARASPLSSAVLS